MITSEQTPNSNSFPNPQVPGYVLIYRDLIAQHLNDRVGLDDEGSIKHLLDAREYDRQTKQTAWEEIEAGRSRGEDEIRLIL